MSNTGDIIIDISGKQQSRQNTQDNDDENIDDTQENITPHPHLHKHSE